MRAAPIGGWFAGDPTRAASQARLAVEVTHSHRDGQEGAAAVAVAAALVADGHGLSHTLLPAILPHLQPGVVLSGLQRAATMAGVFVAQAGKVLGTGIRMRADDTVPFCLWLVANRSPSYGAALRMVGRVEGDADTNGAIVGGVIALAHAPPEAWVVLREELEGH